ncbi:BZ3500_MvSof-1268-A1-R1_Chr8-1g09755 [Microbotryum saponariae]|uniref:BZ3500_MvSof-1268-A1-R1_Chr8-1g09755 protein n=1 Tax=Microbotryum saponariae TaxID=289078 RepID=A0A2X0LLL8_9BASI|nr:BZ3500_MvSof-1268-A1-R1_Chr8-1g09755 [Microbotryum saponariae]SDA08041.1 BZ3501_MvSof-1269-A2-R1_Chr8-1g09478 [Microbotryum saponariae]
MDTTCLSNPHACDVFSPHLNHTLVRPDPARTKLGLFLTFGSASDQSTVQLFFSSVIVFIGLSFNPATCSGQNGPLDQNLARVTDTSGYVLLKGLCSDVVKSPFVSANKAGPACKQVFIPPNDTVI